MLYSIGLFSKFSRKNCHNVVLFIQDIADLIFNHGLFDVVMLANAFYLIPNASVALHEIAKLLKIDRLFTVPCLFMREKSNVFVCYL